MQCSVTYLHHSGFLVSSGDYRLIFDFIGPDGAVDEALHGGHKVIAFASHAHGDHFHKGIADWAKHGLCQLVLGSDIGKGLPASYLSAGDGRELLGAKISAYGSTDQGVSFLVQLPGLSVFHAGDLNDWHWRDESTPKEAEAAHQAFARILNTLPTRDIDIAMFPVDARLGAGHDEGAARFIGHAKPKYFFPMHWWDDTQVATGFAARQFEGTQIIALTSKGQRIDIEL